MHRSEFRRLDQQVGSRSQKRPIAYLEQLIQDSQELQYQRARMSQEPPRPQLDPATDTAARQSEEAGSVIHNHAVGETPWFQCLGSTALPIYISEAACTAFATRLCQSLRGPDSSTPHLPRWRYTDESTLETLFNTEVQWPSLVYAKLLVKTALGHVNPAFHLVLRKETLDVLHGIYQREEFDNPGLKCKYFALFAVGEAFSTVYDTSNTSAMPGSAYFARAMSLLQIIPERPSMNHIESLLLLAYFCQFINRFHSAYLLVGNALRLSLSLGLNYNVPQNQNLHPVEREHRVRIWWSIYMLDRFWGSKAGFPVQIHDDDVHVDLPSSSLSDTYPEHFSDSTYQVATLDLARIVGNTTREIYTRKKSVESFLQREQKLLIQLKRWVQTLPDPLRLQADRPNSKYTVFLHLQFSYCVILAIRPVLLNLLICHIKNHSTPATDEVTPIVGVLSEACIHAARYCLKLCVEEWTGGSVAIFGYAFPVYLFSSALVLVISSLLPIGNPKDIASVDIAAEILRVLSASNSLAAKDLHEHLQRVCQCLKERRDERTFPQTCEEAAPLIADPTVQLPLEDRGPSPVPGSSIEYRALPTSTIVDPTSPYLTTEMTLHNPLLQDFLSQPAVDVGSWDAPEIPNDFDAAFWWTGTLTTHLILPNPKMEAKYTYSFFRVSKTDNIHAAAQKYRDLRLRALKASPKSFASTYELEAAFSDAEWINRLIVIDREVFICAANPLNGETTDHHAADWIGQVTLRGPISQTDFALPVESGQPDLKTDAEEERWQMLSLFTLPEHRGNGLGGKLCKEAIDYLRTYQPTPRHIHVRLMVKPENHATVKLYERLRFVIVGKCTLAEALRANGDSHLLPKDTSGSIYTDRAGLIMSFHMQRS
ncbi:fungal-specific transcription factor domain-containing protein [Penicillium argentinense]|uniref:Fungal-specific transcription factor domain-containing protein n=1 Tax=Penicillium argentinense TaxID=1131581 RepID=A0A9W9FEX5_9EURO|nr:fungal-specific transcription factor domain-containing protein [Penicillium argentinense]KAJ5098824.1 fungal-specific transcription factor domain-containing protein [Penicillium argentinense]